MPWKILVWWFFTAACLSKTYGQTEQALIIASRSAQTIQVYRPASAEHGVFLNDDYLQPVQIAFDDIHDELYWCGRKGMLSTIERSSIFQPDRQPVYSTVRDVMTMHYDTMSQTLYWSESDQAHLFRLHPGNGSIDTLYSLSSAPESFALDTRAGMLFYGNSHLGLTYTIRYDLETQTEDTLVVNNGFLGSYLVDEMNRRLYIALQSPSSIITMDYQGLNQDTLLEFGYSPMAPQAMALDTKTHDLFWTDIGTDQILRFHFGDAEAVPVTIADNPFGLLLTYLPVTTAINPAPESSIRMYPNPCPTQCLLEVPAEQLPLDYQLVDQRGQILRNGQLTTTSITFYTEDLPPGCYFLVTRSSSARQVIPFIKSH
ncbi:MAG: T9SS type A sorting domain-containing protein [Saprospiraceae bacterium]|nr:T9SS type A sorting domain-containing protein [Saprospiraceae bacterium]MCB9317990.1 T9SS type A sorting domain-containing protein [Lewinellaceae bacterium]